MRRPATILAIAAALLLAPPVHSQVGGRSVAVTFDDLPANVPGSIANDPASVDAMTQKIIDAVRKHSIRAIGFVNEGKLFVGGAAGAARRIKALEMWLDAGLELGNHGHAHLGLSTSPLDSVKEDVIRGETVTRKLLEARGKTLRYFRHPFLHVGNDLATRDAFEAFLTSRNYIVAPVTIDNDEFVYAEAYARALRAGDKATAARIGDDYLRYMNEVFAYFEDVSRRVFGREIAHVLLLHANSLNADRFDALAGAIATRGYRFVPLQQALEDPAYRTRDRFTGTPGNSWFNHWEVTAGRPPVPTPGPPAWIAGR